MVCSQQSFKCGCTASCAVVTKVANRTKGQKMTVNNKGGKRSQRKFAPILVGRQEMIRQRRSGCKTWNRLDPGFRSERVRWMGMGSSGDALNQDFGEQPSNKRRIRCNKRTWLRSDNLPITMKENRCMRGMFN